MNKRPIIGITLDAEKPGGYANFPWYALRESYSDAVSKHGGTPILLPYCEQSVDDYVDMIDGLILTGGDFDIDPSYYGQAIESNKIIIKNRRTAFEMAITKQILLKNKPLLGICAGEQLLNVILGGSLIQHIPDSVVNCLEHEQPEPKNIPWHKIDITAGSLLHKIIGVLSMEVNSTHHQAVKDLGKNLVVSAVAPDGVIEAIELPAHPFCLGVEWHPEYEESIEDSKIIAAFVKASNYGR
jgi:putative glutamine amidotransferase